MDANLLVSERQIRMNMFSEEWDVPAASNVKSPYW